MFSPDSELLHIFSHTSYRFHATIGLDPFGNFQEIDGLEYNVPSFEYKELGRNHAPWKLPFEGPASPGELTLKWGMIVRSKLYEWVHDVKLGKDFQKDVWIFQLSHKGIPLRIYHLSGCWPTKWQSGAFSASGPAEMATETVTLAYDNMDMANLSLLAMAGDLVDEPIAALVDKLRPKSYSALARDSQHQKKGASAYLSKYGAGKDRPEELLGNEPPDPLEKFLYNPAAQKALAVRGEGEAPDELEHFTWDPLEQKKLKKRKDGKAPKALDRIEFKAQKRDYKALGRVTDDRKPLARVYKAIAGSFFRDPLEDDYVAMGGFGVGEVEAGESYVAEAGEAIAVGEGMKVEKEEGDA